MADNLKPSNAFTKTPSENPLVIRNRFKPSTSSISIHMLRIRKGRILLPNQKTKSI